MIGGLFYTQTFWIRALCMNKINNLIWRVFYLPRKVVICICRFVSEQHGVFTCFAPRHHFRCTGRIYWQLALDASSSMTEAEMHLNQTDRDSLYQLMCRNKSISHMKGRISMVSPGAGPRCHGSGRRFWKRKKTQRDRQEDSVIFPCRVPNHTQFIFCLEFK